MKNDYAANALYLGINLGHAAAYGQKGGGYKNIGIAINRAKSHSNLFTQLGGMDTQFDSLNNEWTSRYTSNPIDGMRDGPNFEKKVNEVVAIIADRFLKEPSLLHSFYSGFRIGNSEAFASLNTEDIWIKTVGLPQARDHANAAGVWKEPSVILEWAMERQNQPYRYMAIEGARRLLFEELTERQAIFRVRSSRVELPIGYKANGQSMDVKDQDYANAIVIDDGKKRIAIVSVDTLYIHGQTHPKYDTYNKVKSLVKPLIPESLKIDTIILSATHTHHYSHSYVDEYTEKFSRELAKAITSAIIIAAGDPIPAEVGVGNVDSITTPVGFNRVFRSYNNESPPKLVARTDHKHECYNTAERTEYIISKNKIDPVDTRVGILHFRDATTHKPITTLVNHACHPVVLKHDIDRISADFPGKIVNYVINNLGGDCLFLQGAAGDINPWCCLLADDIAENRMNQIGNDIGNLVCSEVKMMFEFNTGLEIAFTEDRLVSLPNWTQVNNIPPESANAYVKTVLLGKEIALAALPGEFFTSLGIDLKQRSPCLHTFFIGYANDTISYVPSMQDWGTKDAYGTTPQGNCGIAKGDGERMIDEALKSIHELRSQIR